ncbi:MAG TPA: cytochrome c biogenesis protein CcdA [Candidatus Methanoperedens sp.]
MPTTPPIFTVFIAGIVTVSKLIIILLLPVIMSESAEGWFRPLAIVGGMTFTLFLMGIFVSGFGAVFASSADTMRIISILLMIGMGAVLFSDNINMEFIKRSNSIRYCLRSKIGILNGLSSNMPEQGLFGGFFLGMTLGIVFIPFLGLLGGILAYVASFSNISYGAELLFVYSLGFSIPMLFIAYLGNIVFGHVNWFVDRRRFFKKLSGLILILAVLLSILQMELPSNFLFYT